MIVQKSLMNTPALLLILDGWGIGPDGVGNVLSTAALPTWQRLMKQGLTTTLAAASTEVGLPSGHQGSSEMGHLMIGAGQPVLFPQTQVQAALVNHAVGQNAAYRKVMMDCKEHNRPLHLVGLLSDRGVHAYAELAYQLLDLAKELEVPSVYIHIIADGRDTGPQELPVFLAQLRAYMERVKLGSIATVVGRYFAMDRDQRWDRVEKAYRLYTEGVGTICPAIEQYLQDYYRGVYPQELPLTDEFIPPLVCDVAGKIQAGDGVIFWNFRVDRAGELTEAFVEPGFNKFSRPYLSVNFVATTKYYDELAVPVAFEQQHIAYPLGAVLADQQLTQLRVAETEKWAYVTKVLDGYTEVTFPLEDKLLISSDKVATYDLRPEMQADAIANAIVDDLQQGRHQVIIANFANADMVAHTGNIMATQQAVEAIDRALTQIDAALQTAHGFMLITADHGNCEQMQNADTSTNANHTANRVPLCLINYHPHLVPLVESATLRAGTLMDVAPTLVHLLDVPLPTNFNTSLLC